MKKILCPLINKEIDEYDCFEIGTVAEGIAKVNSSVGVTEIKQAENFRERCLVCKNHIH